VSSAGPTIVSNIATATGLALLCVKFIFYYMQVRILEFRCSRQTFRKEACILHMLYRNFLRWKNLTFFLLPENLLLRGSPFHIANCFKSFDFKFFLYTCWGAPFETFARDFYFVLTNVWMFCFIAYQMCL